MRQKIISETMDNMEMALGDIDVVILCGGRGERLSSVLPDRPKVLATIGEQTFLDILIDDITRFGFKRIILSVGYLKEQIIDHFKYEQRFNLTFSEENVPLGTGGAVKAARSLIKSRSFLVVNGDSICKVDYRDFYQFHIKKGGLLSMLAVKSPKELKRDFGIVRLDYANRIIRFREKVTGEVGGFINGGVYFMRSDIFGCMPNKASFSLEYELFETMRSEGCYGFLCDCQLIDIGTPERYNNAVSQLWDPGNYEDCVK